MTTLNKVLPCPRCGTDLEGKPCRPGKRGKNSIQVICPVDGRHFRAFITFRPYVEAVLARLATHTASSDEEGDPHDGESLSQDTRVPPEE